jgi:hypothetical protein
MEVAAAEVILIKTNQSKESLQTALFAMSLFIEIV